MKRIRNAHPRLRINRKDGFTLVEVLIAMLVLAILASSMISLALYLRKSADDRVRENAALTVATGFLEQIKTMDEGDFTRSLDPAIKAPLETLLNKDSGTSAWLLVDDGTNVWNKDIEIILDADEDGNPIRTMKMDVQVRLQRSATQSLHFISVNYRWPTVRPGLNRTGSVQGAVSHWGNI